MRIAVAGGTGMVGRLVVEAAREAGHEPVALARSAGVDLMTGAGLEPALEGADVVVDVSNVTSTSARTSIAFFEQTTRRLLDSGRRAGVKHHVALSIVGCDRVDFGYYLGKRRQEELVLAADVPGSVLRATQFHEFAGQVLARVPGPVAVVPVMRSRPVAAREVAEALVRLAVQAPVGMAPELAGPQEEDMTVLARRLLRTRGRRTLVVPVRLPGKTGRAMAGTGLLPEGPGMRGTETFDAWLQRTGGGTR
ncbi:SDR family oxidoreductase [Streptacidiphilus rugosus]|uniref:SDR family oxidoreductase n=1 Tax=Streptacidiphilus rugosus TaxID=405783 RepID=UPI000566718D|nr:NAD(P)H-binding protein [Streptacidiphilus rugosus]